MPRPEKIRLGEVLVKQKLLSQHQLDSALNVQKGTNRRLGKVLVDYRYVTEEQISQALASQLNIDFITLKDYEINSAVLYKLSEAQCRRYRALVLREADGEILVGMADPSDLVAYDDLTRILKKELRLACITEEELLQVVEKYYRNKESLSNIAKELEQDITKLSGPAAINLQDVTVEDSPVSKLLQGVLEDALRSHASDIHIEPQKDYAMIRFRIDGVLQLHTHINMTICAPLISRLKIDAQLDITEKRQPQDGRFDIIVGSMPVDVRLSIIPQIFGEAAVMRLLTQNASILNLDRLGMPPPLLESFSSLVHANEGMILVVGPTGSGKTTTLYAGLSNINTIERKIITIEDPVEYQLHMINQIPVNEKIDFSFNKILRSVLRQDPDVIMVGEIRDAETAQIALRAAMTGHLIFSTLHTKDAISTPARLVDMGIPSYMVASALQAVLSQRLVRLNCKECMTGHKPAGGDLTWVKKMFGEQHVHINFKHSTGCSHCNKTGFVGRTGIYELLEIDSELASHLHKSDTLGFYEAASQQLKGHTMLEGLKTLLVQGKTSVEEVRRMGL